METKGNLTKQKILAKATRLVHQKGFGATSVSELIAATGLKKGSLYFHFPGKDALSLAILGKARAEFLKFLDSSLVGKTPGECLDNFFKKVIEKQKTLGFVGGCIFGNTALEMSDKDKRFSTLIKQVFDEWIEKIQKTIKDAQSLRQVRDDLRANILARHIVATIEGSIMLARLEKSERSLRDCLNSIKIQIGLKT